MSERVTAEQERAFPSRTVRAGSALAAGLLVAVLAALPAAAEIGYQGWELRGGLVLPTHFDEGGFSFGAALDLGEVADGWSLFPALQLSEAEEETRSFDIEISDLALGLEARYTPPGAPAWYFGGGPYVHRTERDVENRRGPGQPFLTSRTDEELGLTGVVGYRRELGGLDTFAEVRANALSEFDTAFLMVGVTF